jgi:predicted aldo/keto reductase-like oxidoreductase
LIAAGKRSEDLRLRPKYPGIFFSLFFVSFGNGPLYVLVFAVLEMPVVGSDIFFFLAGILVEWTGNEGKRMNRRNFLKMGVFGACGFSQARNRKGLQITEGEEIRRTPLRRRMLGRTGEELSLVGLGGVVYMNETQEWVNRLVREVIDQGLNYFDVAPTYGNAEELLGPALKPFRDQVFLACKTQKRDRDGAEEELNQSLIRLGTDHLDLYQLHALKEIREVDQALGWRGAMDAIEKAREEGKIRYIGFSAHSAEAALRAMDKFDFDTILFPVNYVCYYKADFGPEVIKRAQEKKMGILAIKGLARQPWPEGAQREKWPKAWYQPITDPGEAYLAFRFTLSQPIAAAVPPGDIGLFRQALEIAHSFIPINNKEERQLKEMAMSLKPLFPLPS